MLDLKRRGSAEDQAAPSLSSSCYTVNKAGGEGESRGGRGEEWRSSQVTVTVRSGSEQEERERRFEQEKQAVVRICSSSLNTEEGRGSSRRERGEGRSYENIHFDSRGREDADDVETVYDQVKMLKNSVREVNEIVQSDARQGEGRYKAVLIHVRGEEEERREATPAPIYDHPRPLGPRPRVVSVRSQSSLDLRSGERRERGRGQGRRGQAEEGRLTSY